MDLNHVTLDKTLKEGDPTGYRNLQTESADGRYHLRISNIRYGRMYGTF